MRGFRAPLRFATGLLLLATVAPAVGNELPRYKFQRGQQISYLLKNPGTEGKDFQGRPFTRTSKQEWMLNVIDELPEGGWRIVFVTKYSSHTVLEHKQGTQTSSFDGYVDLRPDGTLLENDALNTVANPAALLPKLPPDFDAAQSGWSSVLAFDETRREFRPLANASSESKFRFQETIHTPLQAIHPSHATRDYEFDPERGLVTRVDIRTQYQWPPSLAEKPYERTLTLTGSRILPAADRAELLTQMQRYLEVSREFDRLSSAARTDYAHTGERLAEAEKLLAEARGGLTLEAVREMLDAKQEHLKLTRKRALTNAADFLRLIDQPSPDWSTTDLDGSPRSLADYRGKVVLLDFWYRGCPWCIRAMPQLNQLAADFPDQLAVLGINSDQDASDARFVIERMQLNYPTLANGQAPDNINRKYKIGSWPTLVLIDTAGVVRKIHQGYSPTLREELGAKIRELLAR